VVVVVQEGLRTGIVHYAVDGRLHVLIPKRAGAWDGLNSFDGGQSLPISVQIFFQGL
jgi:hypothetical protein